MSILSKFLGKAHLNSELSNLCNNFQQQGNKQTKEKKNTFTKDNSKTNINTSGCSNCKNSCHLEGEEQKTRTSSNNSIKGNYSSSNPHYSNKFTTNDPGYMIKAIESKTRSRMINTNSNNSMEKNNQCKNDRSRGRFIFNF